MPGELCKHCGYDIGTHQATKQLPHLLCLFVEWDGLIYRCDYLDNEPGIDARNHWLKALLDYAIPLMNSGTKFAIHA